MTYHTYQQLPPIQKDGEWLAHLVRRDDVQASNEAAAIAIAKGMEAFRRASGGARCPIVKERRDAA